LRERLATTKQDATEAIDAEFEVLCEDELAELREIEAEARGIYERHRETLTEVAKAIERELEPLRKRLSEAEHSMTEKLYDLEPDLPDLPEADHAPEGADVEWMFDARRDYLEQSRTTLIAQLRTAPPRHP